MNYPLLLSTAQNDRNELVRLKAEVDAATKKAEASAKELYDALSIVVRPAIAAFNEIGALYKITRHKLNLDSQHNKLCIHVELCDTKGRCPDEDFEMNDPEDYVGKHLRPLVDVWLRGADIPLTLGIVTVPHYYYAK